MPAKTKPAPTPALLEIENAAAIYSGARRLLAEKIERLNRAIIDVKRTFIPSITTLAHQAAADKAALALVIDKHRDQFQESRTVTLHGIRAGLQKGKGRIEWDDEEKVVERIRSQLPRVQAELLLEVKVVPRKEALLTLDAAQLKKLGVTIVGTGDQVFIKATDGEVEKLVDKLLKEGAQPEEE